MSEARTRVAVAGAGGMGREALAWLRDARPDVEAVAFFVADANERPKGVNLELAVIDTVDALLEEGVVAVVLGIGDGVRRSAVADQLDAVGISLLSVVHPTAFVGPGVAVAPGSIVAPGCVITRDVRLGRGSIVNYGAAIGHDSVIDEFAFIGPGAVLTGDVQVGPQSLIGAGAVVLPGCTIGHGARVGAGAVVTDDFAAGATVVGSPARPLGEVGDPPA